MVPVFLVDFPVSILLLPLSNAARPTNGSWRLRHSLVVLDQQTGCGLELAHDQASAAGVGRVPPNKGMQLTVAAPRQACAPPQLMPSVGDHNVAERDAIMQAGRAVLAFSFWSTSQRWVVRRPT